MHRRQKKCGVVLAEDFLERVIPISVLLLKPLDAWLC